MSETDAKRRELENWLTKSRHDLGSAGRLMEGDEPYLDTALYHCQQAAEKALEAFLTYHDIRFAFTHDLTPLVVLASPVEPRFQEWRAAADFLTPYGSRFRYPGAAMEPGREEAEDALRWLDCPVEVLELRSQVKYLRAR